MHAHTRTHTTKHTSTSKCAHKTMSSSSSWTLQKKLHHHACISVFQGRVNICTYSYIYIYIYSVYICVLCMVYMYSGKYLSFPGTCEHMHVYLCLWDACVCFSSHWYAYVYARVYIYDAHHDLTPCTYTQIFIYINTHTHTYSHKHTQTHTHTNTHTDAHTYTHKLWIGDRQRLRWPRSAHEAFSLG